MAVIHARHATLIINGEMMRLREPLVSSLDVARGYTLYVDVIWTWYGYNLMRHWLRLWHRLALEVN